MKKLKNGIFGFAVIFFAVSCVVFSVACIIRYSLDYLVPAIVTGACAAVLIAVKVMETYNFRRYNYRVSYNHTYYINGKNLFENAELIREKKIFRTNKALKGKLKENTVKTYKNADMNLRFKAYELKDDFQVIALDNKDLQKNGNRINFADVETNTDLLIEKIGIADFNGEYRINNPYYNDKIKGDYGEERHYTENKKTLITINKADGIYFTRQYEYAVEYYSALKTVFENSLPHWIMNRDGFCFSFETIGEARKKVVAEINRLNALTPEKRNFRYFITEKQRNGTFYHEFQTGDRKKVFWDKTSLLLSDAVMDESRFGAFLDKNIPDYDYYGSTKINKEAWIKLVKESENESETIRDIMTELTPWAKRSIAMYGCFTIIGI